MFHFMGIYFSYTKLIHHQIAQIPTPFEGQHWTSLKVVMRVSGRKDSESPLALCLRDMSLISDSTKTRYVALGTCLHHTKPHLPHLYQIMSDVAFGPKVLSVHNSSMKALGFRTT